MKKKRKLSKSNEPAKAQPAKTYMDTIVGARQHAEPTLRRITAFKLLPITKRSDKDAVAFSDLAIDTFDAMFAPVFEVLRCNIRMNDEVMQFSPLDAPIPKLRRELANSEIAVLIADIQASHVYTCAALEDATEINFALDSVLGMAKDIWVSIAICENVTEAKASFALRVPPDIAQYAARLGGLLARIRVRERTLAATYEQLSRILTARENEAGGPAPDFRKADNRVAARRTTRLSDMDV
jgi:hypothetical protein